MVLQIGVNRARRVLGTRVDRDRPGAAFIFSGGKEGNQAEQVIAFADEAGEAAFGQSVAAEKFGRVFVGHLGQFRFHFAADGAGSGIGTRGHFGQVIFCDRRFEVFAEFGALADVEHVEHRLLTQKHEAAQTLFVIGRHLHFAEGLFGFEKGFGFDEQLVFFFQLRRLHLLQIFFQTFEPFLDLAEIADHEIELDILDVAQRIDGADVRNLIAFKGAENVNEGVHLAQMADVGGFFQRVLADGAYVYILD